MSDRSSDDLRYLLDDLSSTLDALRDELGDQDRRRSGADRDRPLAPPRPGRFLRFTEEYTIPTLISFLEANIRALELLQGLLGLLDGEEGDRRSRSDRRQFEALGGRTMDQLDGLLDDLQGALEGQPTDPDARELLGDARSLRREIDDHIAGRTADDRREGDDRRRRRRGHRERRGRRSDGSVGIDVTDADEEPTDRDEAPAREESPDDEVDVDAELDSIRREVRGDPDGTGRNGESGDGDGDGRRGG